MRSSERCVFLYLVPNKEKRGIAFFLSENCTLCVYKDELSS